MRSVAQNDYSIECQARFRTIPINEFIDRVTISPLRILRSEAVQDCRFGVFEIKQAQDGPGAAASSSGSWSVLHDRWPPCHRSMIRVVSQWESSGLPVIRQELAVPVCSQLFRSRLEDLFHYWHS